MPKGRIGLSLDEDVLAILNEYGRCEFGWGLPDGCCATCGRAGNDKAHDRARPTRTEIVQTAIREWAARQRTPASPDVQTDPLIDPVIVAERRRGFNDQKRTGVKPKQMLNEAKAESVDGMVGPRGFRARTESVGDAVRRKLPIDTVEKYPASEPTTYCPRHRPKPCAADCEFRVNV